MAQKEDQDERAVGSQKAPSAIRCIKTGGSFRRGGTGSRRQKAPSAIRCIKTWESSATRYLTIASCQKAPSAIRCIKTPGTPSCGRNTSASQKAPSAIRCIKTEWAQELVPELGQKLPSAIRCIKTARDGDVRRRGERVRKHRAP